MNIPIEKLDDSLRSKIESVKGDILLKYSHLSRQQTKDIGPIGSQPHGSTFNKRSKAQPIYSLSLKMTAQTKISYLKVAEKIGNSKRLGPGKILKFLIRFYEGEQARRREYLKNISGYLDQIESEVSNNGYDPVSKIFSPKLNGSIRNLDSYINILGFTRSEVRALITNKNHLHLFELYTVISNHPGSKK